MIVTKHAKTRIKSRIGISKKLANKQWKFAIKRGYKSHQTRGHLKKLIDHKSMNGPYPQGCLYYNGHLFIYNAKQMKVITVIPVPGNIMNNINDYLIKKDQ